MFKPKSQLLIVLSLTLHSAVLGLVMALTPLACDLMGWRGAGGAGAASTGVFFFMGGLLMVLGGVMEFLLGNTFPFVLFCGYG
jgi:succinate-acetate transporter protein